MWLLVLSLNECVQYREKKSWKSDLAGFKPRFFRVHSSFCKQFKVFKNSKEIEQRVMKKVR